MGEHPLETTYQVRGDVTGQLDQHLVGWHPTEHGICPQRHVSVACVDIQNLLPARPSVQYVRLVQSLALPSRRERNKRDSDKTTDYRQVDCVIVEPGFHSMVSIRVPYFSSQGQT